MPTDKEDQEIQDDKVLHKDEDGLKSSTRSSASTDNDKSEAKNTEARIAFLQNEHAKMLSALHNEVEQLKRKNKGTTS